MSMNKGNRWISNWKEVMLVPDSGGPDATQTSQLTLCCQFVIYII